MVFKPNNKKTILIILSLFIFFIVLGVLYWHYIKYFNSQVTEGFSPSLMININNSCNKLIIDLQAQLDDPSNNDLSNNTYYIDRLLKQTTINESVIDLSNNLTIFTANYCDETDCSGIPKDSIMDISNNISSIGKIMERMENLSNDIVTDFSNIQQFHNLSFDCSGQFCK